MTEFFHRKRRPNSLFCRAHKIIRNNRNIVIEVLDSGFCVTSRQPWFSGIIFKVDWGLKYDSEIFYRPWTTPITMTSNCQNFVFLPWCSVAVKCGLFFLKVSMFFRLFIYGPVDLPMLLSMSRQNNQVNKWFNCK